MLAMYEGYQSGFFYLERLPTGAWQPPLRLDQVSFWGRDIAVGLDGAVHFIWYERDLRKVVYKVRRTDGTWGEAEILPLAFSKLSLLVDRQNTVHVLSGADLISRSPGGAWTDAVKVLPSHDARVFPAII
jgi:hypothetical protein